MLRNKLAHSTALRWGILLVLVLALLVMTFGIATTSLMTKASSAANAAPAYSSYQVADGPLATICISSTSSTLCLPLIKPLGSWGG